MWDTVYGTRAAIVNPTTVVLAGGLGQRLGGVTKGLIRVGGLTLVERVLLEAPPGPRFISANRAEPFDFLDLPVVADLEPGRGAPGGVVTALAMSATEVVLVVACDMPNVTRLAIDQLLAAWSDEVDVVCFERRGALEPLLALYRRSLVHRWRPLLASNPSLRGLIRQVRVGLVQADEDALLDSVNTPADLARCALVTG
jgi:molybdopterin-guanine dinucleotide biosynthesis protein A